MERIAIILCRAPPHTRSDGMCLITNIKGLKIMVFSHYNLSFITNLLLLALADSGGGGGEGTRTPQSPNVEAPVYNLNEFYSPSYIFFRNFTPLLCLGWILFFFHIHLVSLCSSFHFIFHLLVCTLYIILTQAITYLFCKDGSKVLCIHYYEKDVSELINVFV